MTVNLSHVTSVSKIEMESPQPCPQANSRYASERVTSYLIPRQRRLGTRLESPKLSLSLIEELHLALQKIFEWSIKLEEIPRKFAIIRAPAIMNY